jgi:hypothetical protein
MQEAVVMTVPAKLVTDTEAIARYVAAGNPREDWEALDDRDRYPWRKMALEEAQEAEFNDLVAEALGRMAFPGEPR